jgi:hypothetical protein
MARDYKSFIIRVEEQRGDDFPVRAEFQGATWQANIPCALPLLKTQEIEQAKQWLDRGFIDRDYAKEFGRRLFDTLFHDDIKEGFRQAYEHAALGNDGVRIVLNLPQTLVDLPWELMYDDEGGHGFLARSTTAPLVRHYEKGALSHRLPERGPLRVLLVTASPTDYPSTSGQDEIEKIRESLSKQRGGIVRFLRLLLQYLNHTHSLSDFIQRIRHRNLFEIDILSHATRINLQNRIVEAQKDAHGYHVVHFAGHGHMDENGSYLIFETDEKKAELVEAESFAEIVGEQSIVLAVLNACQTASASNALRSVAQSTIQRGVPAVVGMQVPILDRTAVGFAEEFYGAWAAGQPIESAISYARRLIKEETPGAAADWGIPILFMKPVDGLKLKTASPPLQLPPMLQFLRWPIRVFLSLLATIGLLFTIPDVNQRLRTEVPIISCVFPYPMEDGFNVVVNEFTVVDENGSVMSSTDGQAVASYIYSNLNNNVHDLDLGVQYNIRPPEHTCLIKGASRTEREVNAAALAEKINADVIVYGVIIEAGGKASFSPEFYVNYEGFKEGDEVTGQHQLGKSLSFVLPFDPSFVTSNNPALSARTEALSLLSVGLAFYSVDNFEKASELFLQAKEVKGWSDMAGKEVIYLLLGNVNNRRASQEKSPKYLEDSLTYFDKAFELSHNTYARALVGKAGVLYLLSLGNFTDDDFTSIDLAKLDETNVLYDNALELPAPESANIGAKVHFGLGQTDLARFLHELATGGDSNRLLAQAEMEFQEVVKEYNGGNVRIANLAGHSYARLGLIAAHFHGNTNDAVDLYNNAINLVTPYYQSYFNTTIGELYVDSCQLDLAMKAYQDAIEMAELYGFDEAMMQYTLRLQEIEKIQCSPASL